MGNKVIVILLSLLNVTTRQKNVVDCVQRLKETFNTAAQSVSNITVVPNQASPVVVQRIKIAQGIS